MFKRLKNFFFVIKPYWKYGKAYVIVQIALTIFTSVALTYYKTCMNRDIIDALTLGKSAGEVALIAAAYIGLELFTYCFNDTVTQLFIDPEYRRIEPKVKLEIYRKAIHTDVQNLDFPEFYDNYSWAIREYAGQSDGAVSLLVNIISNVTSIVTIVSILSTMSPVVIIITLIYTAISIPINMKSSKLQYEGRKERNKQGRRLGYFERVFYTKEFSFPLRITRISDFIFKRYDDVAEENVKIAVKYNKKFLLFGCIDNAAQFLSQFVIIVFYVTMIIAGELSIGSFVSVISASNSLRGNFSRLVRFYKQLNDMSLSADKIRMFFSASSDIEGLLPEGSEESVTDETDSSAEPYKISVNDLSFKYPGTEIGIHDVSFEIERGMRVAVVGPNGSGKSTLIKLLLRLYDAGRGEIRIDDRPIREYDVHKYRQTVGTALQYTSIFSISIRENLSRYYDVDDDEITHILKTLSLDNVLRLSDGNYDRFFMRDFDENGIELSGGERQKVGLGAVMSDKFRLLIMDEPTSALDPLAEYELNQRMLENSEGCTTLFVSHRLSTTRGADLILVMKDGTIIEKGTHEELMERGGLYREMFDKQAEEYI
ncbi:MAG: ABC transporter ATP-binding protein/permease [Firmicutes bacterium]|nr:ABC transporter ATP-binding protein/permease [Bacillota bacterium]